MCNVCQHVNEADFKFCEACGAVLGGSGLSVAKLPMPKTQLILIELGEPGEPDEPKNRSVSLSTRPAVSQLILLDGAIFEIEMRDGYEGEVGRADVSAGWKPLVDLTPHGGERGGVSRRHAVLRVREGPSTSGQDASGCAVFLEDFGSSNGTRVNGRRLTPQEPEQLKSGDEIEFGRIFCRFKGTM